MLHRDYLLEIIEQFVNTVTESLLRARQNADPVAAREVEEAVAGLLDLDAEVALSLEPDSLVTMMILSGLGSSLAEHVTYALVQLADVYATMGLDEVAKLRQEQAEAVAESFGCELDVIPEGFAS